MRKFFVSLLVLLAIAAGLLLAQQGNQVIPAGGSSGGGSTFLGPSPWADIRAYGAKCDDSTDDTSAINSAIAALSGGGTLFVSSTGTGCKYTSTLAISQANLRFACAGEGFQIVLSHNPACFLDFVPGTPGTAGDAIDIGVQGVTWAGVGLRVPSNLAPAITPPASPTLTLTGSGGTLATTEFFVLAYVNAHGSIGNGTSALSTENSIGSIGTNCVTVTHPGASGNATGYNIYMSSSSNNETLQNASPIAVTTDTQICAPGNLGVRPFYDTTAAAAIADTGDNVYRYGKIWTPSTTQTPTSGPYGVMNLGGSGEHFYGMAIQGFSVGITTPSLGNANTFEVTDNSYFNQNGVDIIYTGGTNVRIEHSVMQFGSCTGASCGHIYLISGTPIWIENNYYEQDSGAQFILQIGSANFINIGGKAQGPANVRFLNNNTNCNGQTYGASGPAPIVINKFGQALVGGFDITNNNFANCGSQDIIDNRANNANAAIWMRSNRADTAFGAAACNSGQCGWLTNAGTTTNQSVGLIYDDLGLATSVSANLTPITTPNFRGISSSQYKVVGTAPTCTFTSGGGTTPSCAVDTGSNDSAGIIIATTGSGSPGSTGTITLTFNASLGTNKPACEYMASDNVTAWANGPVFKDKTPAVGSDLFSWTNLASGVATALTASSAYWINYQCIGK